MKKASLTLIVLPLALFPLLVSGSSSQDPDSLEAGRQAFTMSCVGCHGEDGKGNPTMAAMLQVEFPDMAGDYIQDKKDEEIKEVILNGIGKMPRPPGVAEDDIPHIITFIRSLKAKEPN